MSTLLVDGTNLFIIYYAANPALNLSGEPVGGVKGFINFLSKFCHAYGPDKCVIFFDGKNGSVKRRSIYKEYKNGRKPRAIIGRTIGFESIDKAIENKDWQFKMLQDILAQLPVNVIVTDSYETDDGIGYFVKNKSRYGLKSNDDIIIISCDKDFCQLLDDNTSIYNPISKAFVTKENFLSKYEVSQHNWLFYRAVTGDKSDNLPGVPKVGLATLRKVMDVASDKQFSIEDIESLDKNNKIAIKLQENKEIIERNYKLMNLGDPLISISIADKIDYLLTNFVPSLSKKDFILKSSSIPGIDYSIVTSFNSLLMRKNNE